MGEKICKISGDVCSSAICAATGMCRKEFSISIVPLGKNCKSNRPPNGLVPKFIYEELRIKDIADAIIRYVDAGKPVNQDWIDEFKDRLEARNKQLPKQSIDVTKTMK